MIDIPVTVARIAERQIEVFLSPERCRLPITGISLGLPSMPLLLGDPEWSLKAN